MSKVARDLQKMFARQQTDSILSNLQKSNEFQSITKNNYLKDFEKDKNEFLEAYRDTQGALYALGKYLDENEIFNGLKKASEIAAFLTPGSVDNFIIDLINAPTDKIINNYRETLENYQKKYDYFFDEMADNIEKIQSIGEQVRGEMFYYHIGVEDKNQNLAIFQLDSKTMSQFEKDKELFQLNVDKKNNITFKLKENLTGEDVIQGISRAMKEVDNPKQHKNLMYNLTDEQQNAWHELRSTKIYSQLNGEKTTTEVRSAGRRFEIFDETLLSSGGTNRLTNDFSNMFAKLGNEGYYLDNLAWAAGGDLSGDGIGIQNKMFSYNKWTDKKGEQKEGYTKYGFGISSYNSIVEGLKFYKDTKDAISKDSEGNWTVSKDSDFWSAIDNFRQTDNTYSEENIDMVLEEEVAAEIDDLEFENYF